MSAAHQLLNVPAGADDHALIGVAHGCSREQVIEAAQARLRMLAAHPQSLEADGRAARFDIRDAANRVIAMEAKDRRALGAAGASGASSARLPDGLIAAAVLMRRNPRRAHMFLARMKAQAQAQDPSFPHRATQDHDAISDEPHTFDFPEDQQPKQRTSWWLRAFVALSAIGFIIEIFVLRAQMQATQAHDDAQRAQAAEVDATEASTKPDERPAQEREPASSAKTVTAEKSTAPAEVAGPAVVATKPAQSATSEAARLLRSHWQRTARLALEIPVDALSPVATDGDRLDEPIRQAIVLERLAALDLTARKLAAGDDQAAAALMETISIEPKITLPALIVGARPTPEDGDGELAKALERFSGASQSRIGFLRSFRTRPSAPGKSDARVLVQEALKGPSRGSRVIAQSILVDRGSDALEVLEAVEERFTEFAADPALAGMVRALSGVDPTGLSGAPAARAALVKKIILLRGSRIDQLDGAAADYAMTLKRVAQQARIPSPPSEAGDLLRVLNPKQSMRHRALDGWYEQAILHAIVQNGTALVRDQAAILAIRRPADQRIIDRVVSDTEVERHAASSAIGQAIANARGVLELDALLLGVAGLRAQSTQSTAKPVSLHWDDAAAPAITARWGERLQKLSPNLPVGYFNLAEEVADEFDDSASDLLVAQLYSLAATLDPDHLASSAALGLASLQDRTPQGRSRALRWLAIAQRWSDNPLSIPSEFATGAERVGSAVRLGIVEALAQYRRGYGRRAMDRLKKPQVRAYFESLMRGVPGGVEEFDRLAATHNNGKTPPLSPQTTDALLRLEHALLQPKSGLWSDAIALGDDNPTVDAPMGSAGEIFGADPARNRWSANGWTSGEVPTSP